MCYWALNWATSLAGFTLLAVGVKASTMCLSARGSFPQFLRLLLRIGSLGFGVPYLLPSLRQLSRLGVYNRGNVFIYSSFQANVLPRRGRDVKNASRVVHHCRELPLNIATIVSSASDGVGNQKLDRSRSTDRLRRVPGTSRPCGPADGLGLIASGTSSTASENQCPGCFGTGKMPVPPRRERSRRTLSGT